MNLPTLFFRERILLCTMYERKLHFSISESGWHNTLEVPSSCIPVKTVMGSNNLNLWPGIYISSFLVTLCVLQIFPKHFSKLPIHTIHLAKSIKSDSFSSLTFRCRPRRGLCSSRFPYTPLSSQAETPNLTSIKVSLGITSASVTISSNCTCLRFGLLWVL